MNLSRITYRLSLLNLRIEFLSILACMLFFPKSENKELTLIYFLVLSALLVLFSLRNILFLKNIALSSFSHSITVFNLVFLFSIFFSIYYYRSIYFYADIFLISFYSILFFFDKNKKAAYFHSITYMLSLFSLINIIHYLFPLTGKPTLFFANPILQGIISGMAVLITLYYLLKKFNRFFLILLIVNCGGVFVSRSKAAFIGCILFALLLIILKNKKLFIIPAILSILTFIFPNPIRDTFYFSLKKDPYAFDRIYIWQVAVDILKDNLLGVGPGNFSEVSKKYNFKQTKGPAHYFKVPRQTHNDYLKTAAETGLPGLFLLAALLFFILRKIFSSSLFDITRILLLYLLFQAFLFNIIFHAFFFFLFLFLLKILFEEELIFKSFHLNARLLSSFSLLFIFIICYLFPFLANISIEKSKASRDPVDALHSLKRAVYLNPLNGEAHYLQAQYFSNYFKQTANLEYFGAALEQLKKVQRLNRHFTGSYLLESNLYYLLFSGFKSGYVSSGEIIAPLTEAEKTAPLDPFIKLRKAQVYYEFDEKNAAKTEALKALKLEPHFISALYFLHRNFNYFPDEDVFNTKLKNILKKREGKTLTPGAYLYELYKIPGELEQNHEFD